MTHYGICEKCGEPIESPQQPAFPVVGWEVLRSGGGANSIHNRVRVPDRVRHVACIPGSDDAQESLI